ncbi:YfmQ family protein [Pullulanibacillus sp. KACC 23026]|uniref:YfmQ family protein n=1 Tax=Pullulanibacillus sp. KACC 23026 TaxID=3028315 RepID=UPI0023B13FF3|nr:YfmQ family protein [Pullulanibacillus sp. KACC 23026]WEG14711.1 YfmQ family protein [Pullulanibacillus sp. KACC 23026]
MATWEWILIIILAAKLILIVVTLISPPPFVKDWFVSRFELHPVLSEASVSVLFNEKPMVGKEKQQIIEYFNQATFLKKYDWIPKKDETLPLVIESEEGNRRITYRLYSHDSRVDVFKTYKNKVVAYYIRSDNLSEAISCAR